MRRNLLAAGAASCLIGLTGSAMATASAAGSFGPLNLDLSTSGYSFDNFVFGVPLNAYGDTYSQTFTYSFTLHNDGLAAYRTWDECLPLMNGTCGPMPNGHEQVEVDVGFAVEDKGEANISYDITGTLPDMTTAVGPGQTKTFSGSFTITETNIGFLDYNAVDGLFIYAAVFVDANTSPVPEPAEGMMLLAGLGLLGAVARRSARA